VTLRRRARGLGLALLALLSWGGAAMAADDDRVTVRQATLALDDRSTLRMTVSYRDVVDGDTAAKLQGGLPTTIVMRAYVFRTAGRTPLAATYKSCRVTFDLWDEVYRIELSQSGEPDTQMASPTLDGVLRRCAETDRLAVVARAAVPPSATYYVACVVEVNPVSPDMLDRIKRWVSRPSGTGATAPGDALFGSFVGLFVARIGTADRQISFRTQPFSL
jgi:hypothetical protein